MAKVRYEPIKERVLSIDPVRRGFGFVVLEVDPLRMVDWGVRVCAKQHPNACPQSLQRTLRSYEPTVIVMEDLLCARVLRAEALTAFLARVGDVMDDARIPVQTYSRTQIRAVFRRAGVITKDDIAKVLARRFPELAPRVPRRREIWESEDTRMSIFDALSFAITHLGRGVAGDDHWLAD